MDLNRSQKVMLYKFCAYGFLKNLRFFQPLILLFFTVSRGLSYTQFGILIGVREVCVYLFEVPTGILADVTGRRRAMMMAFGSYLFAFAVFTLGRSFWTFVPAMVLFAAGDALRSGTHKSMIMQHLDLEGLSNLKVHYYGTTRSISRLGSAVSALGVGVFAFFVGSYGWIWAATMVPYVFGLLLMTTYPAELDGATEKRAVLSGMWSHTVESARSLWHIPQLGKVVFNESIFEAAFRVAKDYLQPILQTVALSLPLLAVVDGSQRRTLLMVGIAYFFVYMNSFTSSRMSGRLADRTGDLARTLNGLFWILAGAFCVVGLALNAAGFTAGTEQLNLGLSAPAVAALFFFYTLYNLRKPVVVGYLSDRIPQQQRATLLSVQNQLRAILAAVFAPLFGWVADQPEWGIPWAFLLGGVLLFGCGLLLRLKSQTAEPAEEAAAAADAE